AIGQLRELVDTAGGNTVILTGAGVSTDSGIPDYRGPQGSYSRGHKPMMHGEFISSEANRKRYWARSVFGWSSFSAARPNAAHFALAALEAAGKISGIITQNVDGLHQKAGNRNVVDLHGRNDKVECLSCGLKANRNAHQMHLARLNAGWIARNTRAAAGVVAASGTAAAGTEAASGAGGFQARDARLRADGDADIDPATNLGGFEVPACVRCGGVLK
ncbi:unnamed protein product, partial [Sphacelaria rigidula]